MAALLLTGCAGQLDIWGVNVPIPGQGDDDDDDGPPDVDLSNFQGTEYMNIRWDPAQADEGLVDCQEEFETSGVQLGDAGDCADCDIVWSVTLVLEDESRACTSQGTGLEIEDSFSLLGGMSFSAGGEFTMGREADDSDGQLVEVGQGAFNGLYFTWSGVGGWEDEFSQAGFSRYFSGEGYF